ncbi:MAG: hypothetical protein WCT25_01785 [Candidatus Paceibacterota bacterium]|jgi:ribulose-phosphate 3-epimerase
MDIIPAIIAQDFEDLRSKMSLVADLVPLVQVDALDGEFAPYKSWPYLSGNQDGDFANILNEDIPFPFWDRVDFEVHLMTVRPEDKIKDWIKAGASRILFHVEATDRLEELVNNFRKDFPLGQESLMSVELGAVLNMKTPVSAIEGIAKDLDSVQFMSINQIGKQGERFDERVFDRIDELHQLHPDLVLSVDGGVSLDNADELMRAGATRLVVGSALFKSDDLAETIRMFKDIKI